MSETNNEWPSQKDHKSYIIYFLIAIILLFVTGLYTIFSNQTKALKTTNYPEQKDTRP